MKLRSDFLWPLRWNPGTLLGIVTPRCGLNRAVLDNEGSLAVTVDQGQQWWMVSTKGPKSCISCRGIAEMPLRRFDVEHTIPF